MKHQRFGRYLTEQLRLAGKTQKELAEAIGVSQSKVSTWTNGHARPSSATCDRIAEALSLDVDVVLTEAGHRPHLVTDDEPELRDMVETLRHIPLDQYGEISGYLQYQLDRARRQRRSRLRHIG